MDFQVLLCKPSHYSVFYKINPWMNPGRDVVDQKLALSQWQNLVEILKDLGVKVYTLDQVEGLPDMTFAANGFFSIGKKAIVSRFHYRQRQGESKYFRSWLEDHGFNVHETKSHYEGQGDTRLIDGTIFQGWGFRSDKRIAQLLTELFPQKQVVPLRLVDSRFYHLDTCFLPINDQLVLYFSEAFDAASDKKIKSHFKKVVGVSEQEAVSFSLNGVVLGEKVIINSSAKKLASRLKSLGLEVITADTSQFQKSGGSVKCLTNELFELS